MIEVKIGVTMQAKRLRGFVSLLTPLSIQHAKFSANFGIHFMFNMTTYRAQTFNLECDGEHVKCFHKLYRIFFY